MHFFFVVFFYILSHSRLLYFNSLLYTFSFVRRRRRRLFSFFREIRSFFAPAPHTVPFCYSTLQFESRQNSRMLRNCQRDFCTGDATTIQQLFFDIIIIIMCAFLFDVFSFVECASLDGGRRELEYGVWLAGWLQTRPKKCTLCLPVTSFPTAFLTYFA